MFKALINRLRGRPALPAQLSYEDARSALEAHSADLRLELAGRHGVEPEILYYLAEDRNAGIRRRVAANSSTPAKANRLLADDTDEEVRAALARKIGRLVPHLKNEESERVRDLTLETLDRLARDQLPRVRAIVAAEIKACKAAPQDLVRRLARDPELSVAAPLLEYSPLLSDADLLEIVNLARVSAVISAIARRRNLSVAVSDAVIASMDITATAALLDNPAANISKASFEALLDRASAIEAWHEPLVRRPNLSTRVMRRIAGFVSAGLIEKLAARPGLDAGLAAELKLKTRRAISEGAMEAPTNDAARVVREAAAGGALDDHFVTAAAELGQRDVVTHGLATLAEADPSAVQRLLESRNARAVTAIVWRAGLHMRTAVAIQSSLLKLSDVLPARGGTEFPLAAEDMALNLSLFGLSAKSA
ncbi:MAG: DUF2336 domain-containing protein [Micropepsaceae bacterium]